MELSEDIKQLFQQAEQYDQAQDHYNAIKLYKRVIKDAPAWVLPYTKLSLIYKYRQEWKPALYYSKKTAALDAGNKEAWWNIGLAATALKKDKLAWNIWSKFGYEGPDLHQWRPASVRLTFQRQIEVMGLQRISPCLGYIRSIPQPASGRRYGDLVLVDHVVRGYHSSGHYRLPIYDELGVLKCSHYRSFSCRLLNATEENIQLLQRLCHDRKLGFEVWGNAAQAMNFPTSNGLPEFHAFRLEGTGELLVSIAARQEQEAVAVLKDWEVISLSVYTDFRAHQLC